jgi:outer membrane receptor for ferrienterochelin and colicin
MTHGESSAGNTHQATREYKAWNSMKSRCLQEKNCDYPGYGGRGITVCAEWVKSYAVFLADMGRCPEGMSLDRKDNMQGYSKDNCRWATLEEQNNNTRRNISLTHNGETLTIAQWARKIGMKKITLWQRITYYGCSPEEALTAPVTPNGRGMRK